MKILARQQVLGFLSVYVPQCFLKDAVKDLFYDQLRAIPASTSLIPYDDCNDRGGSEGSGYKEVHVAEGMRGSRNMHWLMTCSSVTCTPRNVTVTSLHTGQVIQTVLFHKSLRKLVTDVMVIAGEMVALQHQLVSDVLVDMLPKIKYQFTLSTCPRV